MSFIFSTKTPTEVEFFTFDFSLRLAVGERIQTATVGISLVKGVTDPAMSSMISTPAAASGSLVQQKVSAGVDGNTYRLSVEITTSTGQTLDDMGYFTVQVGGGS